MKESNLFKYYFVGPKINLNKTPFNVPCRFSSKKETKLNTNIEWNESFEMSHSKTNVQKNFDSKKAYGNLSWPNYRLYSRIHGHVLVIRTLSGLTELQIVQPS